MPVLRIEVLGGFSLHFDGAPIAIAHATRLQALLTYLLLRQGSPVYRQQVASSLWPDSSETQARTNLRKQLLLLHQLVPGIEQAVCDDGRTLALLSQSTGSDLREFSHAIGQHDHQRAVMLYKGELLPGCYDEWIAPEREWLRNQFFGALEAHASELEAQRSYGAALRHAEQLAHVDPLHEGAVRRLMRLYALNGDRSLALRVYHAFAAMLKQEIGAEPEQATRDLFIQLSASQTLAQPMVSSPAPAAALVGRTAEWRRLREAWAAAEAEKPQFVLITGEAGIGKTRLAEELLAWADRQGILTALARCYAAEGALAYAPIAAWLRAPALAATIAKLEAPWLSEVARLVPEVTSLRAGLKQPGPFTEGWHRQRLFEALARAITGPSHTSAGRVLLIDNAQWADRESIEWLHYLLRRHPCLPLVVVATVRDDMPLDSHPLRALQLSMARENQLVEIELAPLSSRETTELAEGITGRALSPGQSADLYRETEGRPLFVIETMRMAQTSASEADHLRRLPPTVQSVLNQRLEQLSPSARDLASQAACIGREFSSEVLALICEGGASAAARDLDELLQRRIVRESVHGQSTPGMAYDFTHDKIREAAYARLSAPTRQQLHRRVAAALEQLHANTSDRFWGQIAVHYDRANDARAAIANYWRAAEVAHSIYANSDAIRDYRRAMTLLAGLEPAAAADEIARIGEALGDVLHHVSRGQEACAAYAASLNATRDPLGAAQLHCKTGNALRDERDYQPAMHAYAKAIEILGEPSEAERTPQWWHVWIQVRLELLLVHYWLGQVDEGDAVIASLKPIIDRHGTTRQSVAYFQTASRASLRRNGFVATEETVTYAQAALTALRNSGESALSPSTEFGLGFALLWHGELDKAVAIFLTVLSVAEQTGDSSLAARCVTYLAVAYRLLDKPADAEHYVSRALIMAETAHMPEYTALAHANAAWLAWRKNDIKGAREQALSAVEGWKQFPLSHASTTIRWTAYFPLLAIALHDQALETATACVRVMLDPHQQRLPAILVHKLEHALSAQTAAAHDVALQVFRPALELAANLHYL